jgi:hypothetical protein
MKTKFTRTSDGKAWDYEGEDLPVLPRGTLVYGPWGALRVESVAVDINGDEPRQSVALGLVNIHA